MSDVNETIENEQTSETVDTAAATEEQAGEPEGQEKKYTDSDVDRIVKKKLAREREKFSKQRERAQREDELEQREKALEKRELKADARDLLTEEGLPRSLAELLSYGSKEEYETSLEAARKAVKDLREAWEKERATGRTPRRYGENKGDPVKAVFRP